MAFFHIHRHKILNKQTQRLFSSGVVGKLQQYERDILSRAGGSDSGSTDCGLSAAGYSRRMTCDGAILLLTDAMKLIADSYHDKRVIREIEAEK